MKHLVDPEFPLCRESSPNRRLDFGDGYVEMCVLYIGDGVDRTVRGASMRSQRVHQDPREVEPRRKRRSHSCVVLDIPNPSVFRAFSGQQEGEPCRTGIGQRLAQSKRTRTHHQRITIRGLQPPAATLRAEIENCQAVGAFLITLNEASF